MRGGQRQRLVFLEAVLQQAGLVRRRDVVDEFDISLPQATVDLRAYQELAPGNMVYDVRARVYRRGADFVALFEKCFCKCCGHPHECRRAGEGERHAGGENRVVAQG